mgnify:CR=1 FL=1
MKQFSAVCAPAFSRLCAKISTVWRITYSNSVSAGASAGSSRSLELASRYTLDDGETADDETAAVLGLMDALRRQSVAALVAFEQEVRAAGDVRGITTALYHFLVELDVPARLQEWAERAEQEGRLADAAEHRQLWEDSMALFDQLVETSGDENMSLNDYENVLSDGLDALQISLIRRDSIM